MLEGTAEAVHAPGGHHVEVPPRDALAELYWDRKGNLDSLWWRAIREPPD